MRAARCGKAAEWHSVQCTMDDNTHRVALSDSERQCRQGVARESEVSHSTAAHVHVKGIQMRHACYAKDRRQHSRLQWTLHFAGASATRTGANVLRARARRAHTWHNGCGYYIWVCGRELACPSQNAPR